MFHRFLVEEDGATAIEYALIASMISIAIITAVNAVADANSANYTKISSAVEWANAGGN